MEFCPKCWRVSSRVALAPQRRRYPRPPIDSPQESQKPRLSTRSRETGDLVAAAFEWLRRRKNKQQILVALTLGLLLMLVAVFSVMRGGGEEDKGEIRTKSLVYDTDSKGKLGLYWMDDKAKANKGKVTSAELRRCEELHPDEVVPICQTTYYEKAEDKR